MSRSPAKYGNAIAMKSLKEKWSSIVQSTREKGENEIGGSSTITFMRSSRLVRTETGGVQEEELDY